MAKNPGPPKGPSNVPRGNTTGLPDDIGPLLRPTGDDDPDARVVRLDRAIRCCKLSSERVLRVFDEAIQALGADVRDEASLAMIPAGAVLELPGAEPIVAPQNLPRVIRIPSVGTAGGLALGAAGGALLLGFEYLGQLANSGLLDRVVQALSQVSGAVARDVRRKTGSKSPCEECLASQALRQKPRKRKRVQGSDGKVHWVRA